MEIEELLGELPGIAELIKMEFSCDFQNLYEVLIMGIKNRLVGIQVNNKNRESREKKTTAGNEKYVRGIGRKKFGGLEKV